MLKLYTYNITSPDKGFYSLSLSGIKSAIGCEKVIPRSDSKLLDLHVWLGVEALIKSSIGQRRIRDKTEKSIPELATHLFPREKRVAPKQEVTSVCNHIVKQGRTLYEQCSLAFTNFITKKGEIYEKPRRNLSKDS